MPDTPPAAPLFDRARVRRGNRTLLITALILAATTAVGAAFRDAELAPNHWAAILYAVGLSGLVGFGTNWIAIKMLFHPRKHTFGFQGVIPAKKAELAASAARLMEERLISGHRLQAHLAESGAIAAAAAAFRERLPAYLSGERLRALLMDASGGLAQAALPGVRDWARKAVADKVREKLGFMAGLALPLIEPMVDEMLERLAWELGDTRVRARMVDAALPQVEASIQRTFTSPEAVREMETAAEAGINALFAKLRVADLIEAELLKQSEEEVEQMVDDVAADQLVFLQVAGGVLGAVAGLALIWPWVLAVLAVPAVALAWMSSRRSPKTSA